MALPSRININHGDAFEHGALGVKIEALNDYEKVKAGVQDPQQRDKDTGQRIWLFRGIDNDPDARSSEVKVKIVADVMPPLPGAPIPGTNLYPVEFEGLTVTPYVEETKSGFTRVAYSLKATGVREPQSKPSTSASSTSQPSKSTRAA
jgi:hypothetical protein